MPASPLSARASALTLALALGGCGWVDSTGRQSGDGADAATIRLDDTPPGGAIPIDEDKVRRFEASGAGAGATFAWSEEPLEEGALDSCASLDDFRADIAATRFAEACTDPDDCTFELERVADEETDEEGGAEAPATGGPVLFALRVPPLKAPVGVRAELSVTAASGERTTNAYDFCLISINIAPDAVDDGPYVLREGETLTVSGDEARSLLANDTDDEDAANRPLEIDPVPRRAPTSSGAFSLGSDGGFSYTAREGGILDFASDSFVYAVSDGVHVSEATVSLRIEAGNGAPFVQSVPPPLEATVGVPFAFGLAGFFADPDDDPLRFSASGDELPSSGSLALSPDGVLAGTPIEEDIGDYLVTVVVSDGTRETRARIGLTVLPAPNTAPEYVEGSIGDVRVRVGRFMEPQTPRFVDAEGDALAFELVGEVPVGIGVDPDTGTLSGLSRRRGTFRGLFILATDPDGESARSETFTLRVF